MNITFVSVFPEVFESFLSTSLIKKAQDKGVLNFSLVNPRDFCPDKHKQIDDEIYGGGAGMLMKAKPIIDAVENVIKKNKLKKNDFSILFPSPSSEIFQQSLAHNLSEKTHLIFVCGRYEGIDHRFELYMQDHYPQQFHKISLGQFVTLGGELPAMTMTEAIVRLIPGVIKEEASRQDESYSVDHKMQNLEYPQYTRPEDIYGYQVPEVLISGNHKKINEWRKSETQHL